MTPEAFRSARALRLAFALPGLLASVAAEGQERAGSWDPDWRPPTTAWGHPDLQGNWSNATLTTFERRPGLGPVYTPDEVDAIEDQARSRLQTDLVPSDPDRAPPPVTGSVGRSYNQIYYEPGERVARVNGEPRTSLITDPADGRIPALSPEGTRRKQAYEAFRARFGEFDHPELRPLAERCLAFYGSSPAGVMGPPMIPTRGYNNNFTIVQNAGHVLIYAEMMHDVRIVRLGEPDPLPAHVRPWFGDSWGRWEGNTLVVETTNIHPGQSMNEQSDKIVHSEDLRVVERFARVGDDTILYEFEVHDPRTYSEVWGGEVPWKRLDQQIFEFACHEGNYALSNILSGARYQEGIGAREPR